MDRRFNRLLYAVLLFAVNAYVCWRAFGLEYSQYMSSIEGAYVGISRHLLASWHDLSWWPAWYTGIPFRNSYPPLLHMLVAVDSAVMHVSVVRAHHIVTALFYCLGPVFAYALLVRLSGKPFLSFCAALGYAVLSPSGLLIRAVALDMEHPLRPRRLSTLIAYGDGPHLSGLSLLPLALLCLDLALVRRTVWFWGAAAASFVAVVFTNWLAAFSLAILVICYLAAYCEWRRWWSTALFAAGTYLVAMPWAPPSLIRTIQFNARTIGGDFTNSYLALLHSAPWALLGFAVIWFVLRRLKAPPWWQMLMLFSAAMAWVTLGWFWFGVAVLPQPDRYHLEMDLGLMLAGSMGLGLALEKAPRKAQQVIAVIFFLLAGVQLYKGHRYARDVIKPVDITSTVEYQSARWLEEHMPGVRVMVPGSIQFWLSAFADNPQIGGGFEQGNIQFPNRIAQYQILSGDGTTDNDVAISLLWLKAFGVEVVEAGGPGSREFYHPFKKGDKFKGQLPEVWRNGDDALYRIPLRNNSLAHVMRPAHLVTRMPVNGIDTEQLRTYVDAIDDPAFPEAQFVWRTQHSAEILAPLKPNRIVSVQITYTPGWHAIANGHPARVFSDGLGFLAIAPDCDGNCRMELTYDGGMETRIAQWLSRATILGWVLWAAYTHFSKRNFRAEPSLEFSGTHRS